jgi:hypothetical protein
MLEGDPVMRRTLMDADGCQVSWKMSRGANCGVLIVADHLADHSLGTST